MIKMRVSVVSVMCLLSFLTCWMSVSETHIYTTNWTLQLNDPPEITDTKHGFIYIGKVTLDVVCASPPLAAGIIALEANPRLTWRDVRCIVIRVSRPAGLRAEDWRPNGVGRLVSHYFGYVRLDADRMIELVRKWRWNRVVCQGSGKWIRTLKHVRLHLIFTNTQDLTFSLNSPINSKLLTVRPLDWSYAGCHDWIFVRTHFWHEVPAGYWALRTESANNLNRSGLSSWFQMEIYGSKEHMTHHRLRRHIVQNCEVKDQNGTCEVCTYPYYLYEKFCLVSCPPHHYEEERNSSRPSRMCIPCHRTCSTCYGPLYTQCLTCPPYSTPDPDKGTCNKRWFPWERNRRQQEAEMWITLAIFAGLLLTLVLCACTVSCIRCRMQEHENGQNDVVNFEMEEMYDVQNNGP